MAVPTAATDMDGNYWSADSAECINCFSPSDSCCRNAVSKPDDAAFTDDFMFVTSLEATFEIWPNTHRRAVPRPLRQMPIALFGWSWWRID